MSKIIGGRFPEEGYAPSFETVSLPGTLNLKALRPVLVFLPFLLLHLLRSFELMSGQVKLYVKISSFNELSGYMDTNLPHAMHSL